MSAEHSSRRHHSDGGDRLLHRQITGQVIGAFYDVCRRLKPGYLEAVYANSLYLALQHRGLECEQERPLQVHFMGHVVGDYRADLIVEGRVLVEVKAVRRIVPRHEAQLINYLQTTGIAVGLLMNFGARREFWRRVLSPCEERSAPFRVDPRRDSRPGQVPDRNAGHDR